MRLKTDRYSELSTIRWVGRACRIMNLDAMERFIGQFTIHLAGEGYPIMSLEVTKSICTEQLLILMVGGDFQTLSSENFKKSISSPQVLKADTEPGCFPLFCQLKMGSPENL